MIPTVVLRPAAHAFIVVLTLAHTMLTTRIPELPDWDDTIS